MIFIVLLAYITCTTNQHTNKQNNNLLISTDGYDIKTVMQDLKKFIIKDFPDLYEKMKKEEDIDNEKVVSKKYKPKIDSLKNYRKEMKKEEDIDNEKVVSKKYKPKIDSLKNYRKEIKKEEDIDNEKVVSKKYKPKIDSLKNYRKLLLDPYSKERSKKMKQANIKDFQYIQTEEGKVFLILN
jgi:DNA repair ATPase RecN